MFARSRPTMRYHHICVCIYLKVDLCVQCLQTLLETPPSSSTGVSITLIKWCSSWTPFAGFRSGFGKYLPVVVAERVWYLSLPSVVVCGLGKAKIIYNEPYGTNLEHVFVCGIEDWQWMLQIAKWVIKVCTESVLF